MDTNSTDWHNRPLYVLVHDGGFGDAVPAMDGERDMGMVIGDERQAIAEAKRQNELYDIDCAPVCLRTGRVVSMEPEAETPAGEPKRQIVIADKGFIFYGDVTHEAGRVVITNGGTVRRFAEPDGGLGRLASHSPSANTKLDPSPRIEFPAERWIGSIDVEKGGI